MVRNLLIVYTLFLNAHSSFAKDNFAGNYFPLERCNAALGEGHIIFDRVDLDETQVELTALGGVITAFAGNYWAGAIRFGIYSNQRIGDLDFPDKLLTETYSFKYYPQNSSLSTPFRVEIQPLKSVSLQKGIYWLAVDSNVVGKGNANVGCEKMTNNGNQSMTLTNNEVAPFFPATLDPSSFHLEGSSTNLNFYFLFGREVF